MPIRPIRDNIDDTDFTVIDGKSGLTWQWATIRYHGDNFYDLTIEIDTYGDQTNVAVCDGDMEDLNHMKNTGRSESEWVLAEVTLMGTEETTVAEAVRLALSAVTDD